LIKSIIFDFDGVILDSNKIKSNAFTKLFKDKNKNQENLDMIIRYHKDNMGISRNKKIKFYYENILKQKITNKEVDKIASDYSKLVFNKIIKTKFISGSKYFLSKNFKRYLFFVSSGTPENELINICEKRKIDKYFTGIYGSPDNKEKHIKRIMKKNSLKENEVIFIGDALADYNAAVKNKIFFIGINYINNRKNKKNFYINNFNEVENIIKKIN
jgi:HAD superfamily hydrolase (TIGR01549 family)